VQRLRYVLQVLEPSVGGKKATLPILQNVVVGQGRAYATNLATAVSVEMTEAADNPVLLPHSQLLNLLKHTPGATRLTINREGAVIKLAAGATAVFPVPGEVADFPPFPSLKPAGEGKVDADLFLKTATALTRYAATDGSRPVLQCVCITLGGPLEMASADGFRLAWQTLPVALPAPNSPPIPFTQLLLPAEAVHALAKVWAVMEKMPSVDDQSVVSDPTKGDGKFRLALQAVAKRLATVRFTQDALSFEYGAVTIRVQLAQGSFPDYHQLIPTDLPNKVSFDAEQALRVLKSVAAVAAAGSEKRTDGHKTPIVRLQWAGERLTFSARTAETGAISGEVRAHIQGGEGKIAFDHTYLMDYLAGKLGPVLLETSSPSAAGRFFCAGSPDVLIMPLFVTDPAVPTTEPAVDQPATGGSANSETPEEPTDDRHARRRRVDEGTPEEPATTASPSTISRKSRRGK
jgi:DNA polymerase III sliding clamp (beta) subunit (PCNA family)